MTGKGKERGVSLQGMPPFTEASPHLGLLEPGPADMKGHTKVGGLFDVPGNLRSQLHQGRLGDCLMSGGLSGSVTWEAVAV